MFFTNQQPIHLNPPRFHNDILLSCTLYSSGYDENKLGDFSITLSSQNSLSCPGSLGGTDRGHRTLKKVSS